jgi:polyhydroxyalkanoate synthase
MTDGRAVALQNIHVPIFVVGTERDHVAPWRSVYTIHYHADTEVTFALAAGGHNTGIVSEPGHRGQHYRIAMKRLSDPCLDPDEWAATAGAKDGSWWEPWADWLAGHSTTERVSPPPMGAVATGYPAIEAAPGSYVLQT